MNVKHEFWRAVGLGDKDVAEVGNFTEMVLAVQAVKDWWGDENTSWSWRSPTSDELVGIENYDRKLPSFILETGVPVLLEGEPETAEEVPADGAEKAIEPSPAAETDRLVFLIYPTRIDLINAL